MRSMPAQPLGSRLLLFLLAVVAVGFIGISTRAVAAHTIPAKTVWFGNDTIGPNDVINGDLDVIFANVVCDGGAVAGDVRVFWGSFDTPDCQVGGDVTYVPADSIGGIVPWVAPHFGAPILVAENRRLLTGLAYSALVLLVFLLFPLRVRMALDRVERHPGLSAAVGTLAAVAVVPIAILLALSIIGIPLIVVEVAALFAGIRIGQGAVAILIGRRLFELARPQAAPSPLAALVLGLVVVSAAEAIPVFGWAVTALVALIGLGAAILGITSEASFQRSAPRPPIGGTPMKTS